MIVNHPFVGQFSPLRNAIVRARQAAAGVPPAAFSVDNAAILDSADSSFLAWTPGATVDQQKGTCSFWCKRNKLGTAQTILHADNSNYALFGFAADDTFNWITQNGVKWLKTARVFRDTAALLHIHIKWNTTQATEAYRFVITINGIIETAFTGSYPSQNHNLPWFLNAVAMNIGRRTNGDQYSNSTLSEMHLLPGIIEDVSLFGEFDDNGVWQPIEYTGHDSNGQYLDFADNTHFGNDVSGNNIDWTDSGFTTDHQVPDTPSNNFCTLSELDKSPLIALSDGALKATSTNGRLVGTTFALTAGQWYWENKVLSGADLWSAIGVMDLGALTLASSIYTLVDFKNNGWLYSPQEDEAFDHSTTGTALSLSPAQNFPNMCALDLDLGYIWFGYDGTWYNSGDPAAGTNPTFTGVTGPVTPIMYTENGRVLLCDFGQRGYDATPPSGFNSLCSDNLPTPDILKGSDHFNAILHAGNSSTNAITGVGFQLDLLWTKDRDGANAHVLADSVRGATKQMHSNLVNVEQTDANIVASIDLDGFTLGDNSTGTGATNISGNDYVDWCFKKGVTSGFDIVPYVGTGAAHTENHSLGVVPELLIVKNRERVTDWRIYNKTLGATKYLVLNGNNGEATSSGQWNDTAPTSSVFTVGTASATNELDEDHIAYLFASVEGFSKVGSYPGSGTADGPFVWCGFRPALVVIKRVNSTGGWFTIDSARDIYNECDAELQLNASGAEITTATNEIDILSNGFKLRNTGGTTNTSGGEYIFMAFAEHPFKTARAR